VVVAEVKFKERKPSLRAAPSPATATTDYRSRAVTLPSRVTFSTDAAAVQA
jgi:hypothetical protein